jgi:leucyl/phenylalanyl-tRNA---protein transferase
MKRENYKLLDCQVYNDHLAHLGAFEIPRKDFMWILQGD